MITFEEIMDLEECLPSVKVNEAAKRLDDSDEEEEAKSQENDDDFVIV